LKDERSQRNTKTRSSADVTLVAKDGKEFKAHRQVLSEASPFFEKLLNSDMKENNEGVIRLEILTASQMNDIVEFIYTGKIEISTEDQAENLIEVADYLCLSNLKQKAVTFLKLNMSTSNCFCVYHVAENYRCEELITCAQRFVNSNFAIVAETEDFMRLPSREVEKWISSDEIAISREEDVYKTILKWIDHNRSDRSVKFSELFRHVRLTFVPRDFLISDVINNDLVKGNKDCFDGVTSTLAWIDRFPDYNTPRPHVPRKAFETSVIALSGVQEPFHNSLYFPDKDVLYRLPERTGSKRSPERVVSCRGKLLFVSQDIDQAQCYDPELNRWSPAPWTRTGSKLELLTDEQELTAVLVVKNEICFVIENSDENLTWLWKYNLDANSTVPSVRWLDKTSACLVVVDRYIYAIGGYRENSDSFTVVPQCARFDTEEHGWQEIASLQEARYLACGVAVNDNIYVAGGCDEYNTLKTCEVYNVKTDEWYFIAPLTCCLYTGSMVLFDRMLFAFCPCSSEQEWAVECLGLGGKDDWNVKTRVPISKKEFTWEYVNACSFRLYKGALDNLQPTQIAQMERPLSRKLMLAQYAVM